MAAEGRAVLAPAKVNLFLHVTGRRPDGYHLLDSLVVFAGTGDRLAAEPAADWGLDVSGPFAAAAGAGEQNLVLRAARAAAPHLGLGPLRFRLEKRLPVAAGLGGGSADAAAALRLMEALAGRPLPVPLRDRLALGLGADLPVCLAGRPARMSGIGERLEPAGPLPPLWLVLANPGLPLATRAVFGALAGFGPPAGALPDPAGAAGLRAWLAGLRNDLEAPARALLPGIGAVLAALAACPGLGPVRMSGSGPTCFGLAASAEAAAAAAASLGAAHPGWWVASAPVLAGPPAIVPA